MDTRVNLARLLSPSTLAVVGANEKLGMSNNAVLPMLESGREVSLVNPNRDMLYGQAAFSSLTAVGRPVDAVLALVNSERSLDVVEEAAALGCGGVVIAAAGFVEQGEQGAALQERLQSIARSSGLAIVGPNCSGFKNVPLGVNLFTGGRLDLRPGGVAVVSQSGFLVRSAMAAAKERDLGVSIAVSSGNEAVCDLADYVAVLAADEHTSVICLVIETIRRPGEFFEAVAVARTAGKPVIARSSSAAAIGLGGSCSRTPARSPMPAGSTTSRSGNTASSAPATSTSCSIPPSCSPSCPSSDAPASNGSA